MQIIPMRELKNTTEVERRCAEENGPVYVTKNGYGRLVVMDIIPIWPALFRSEK